MKTTSCLALACLAAAPLAAQTERIVPANLATTEGNLDSRIPFTLNAFRFQQLYDGSSIATRTAVIADCSFRRGNGSTAAFSGTTLQKVVVLCSTTKVSPGAMTTTFASNNTSTQTQVFSGNLVLPAQPTSTPTGPFNVTVKFVKPFTYVRADDHILLEFQVGANTTSKLNYPVDSSNGAGGGTIKAYGTGGTLAGGAYAFGSTAAGALVPGGRAVLELSAPANYPAVGIFGFSDKLWGPVNLPLDLTSFGAPGNSLLVSFDLVAPMVLTQGLKTWDGDAVLPLPNVPAAVGATVFGQALIVDARSNKLGMVLTDGLSMTLPAGNVAPYAAIYSDSSTATTGSFLLNVSGSKYNGLVTRFGGVFP
ncbi:MAG: hypothetical protein R3F30_05920 [Planctomycetota bacterium]